MTTTERKLTSRELEFIARSIEIRLDQEHRDGVLDKENLRGDNFHKVTAEYSLPSDIDYNTGVMLENTPFYIPTEYEGSRPIDTPKDLVRLVSGVLINRNYTNKEKTEPVSSENNYHFWSG